jgi:hypothetical protein
MTTSALPLEYHGIDYPSRPVHFTTWTGPLVHLASQNGGVHRSFSDEEPAEGSEGGGGGFSSAFRGFMTGLFGTGCDDGNEGQEGRGMGTRVAEAVRVEDEVGRVMRM